MTLKAIVASVSLCVFAWLILSLRPDWSEGAMGPKEIWNAVEECKSAGKHPVWFRSAFYRDVREIRCGESEQTIYY